jgi:hypothetical protein
LLSQLHAIEEISFLQFPPKADVKGSASFVKKELQCRSKKMATFI